MDGKILLVDDSRELLGAYVAVLESSTALEVRTASSGRAALRIVREWRPDVVVTDVVMPDMDGLDLISHIRSDLPPPLPIIVAWSGFPEFEREARRRGAREFQEKPIDPDDLVVLLESLLGQREPPVHLRADARARRRAASELARVCVSETLARRPYFREVAGLNARQISRYFDGADVAVLVLDGDQMRVFAASDSGPSIGPRLEGVLGYAADVLQSGSTFIAPDIAAVPAGASRGRRPEAQQLLVTVPLRSAGTTIGALALADRRPIPFDVHDLAILQYVGDRYAEIFAGKETSPVPREPGVLGGDTWRYLLRREMEHLPPGGSVVLALASLPARDSRTGPIASREEMNLVTGAMERFFELLLPRTALGSLAPGRIGAYSLVADAPAGEHALRALLASLADEPDQACLSVLSVAGLVPTDGGAALLAVAQWLLASAMARGPGTTLRAHVRPEIDDGDRLAA